MKQAMDELTETNTFNLWKYHWLPYQQIKVKSRNAVCYFFFLSRRLERIKTNAMAKGW